jgi:hypothetical protein
MLSEKEAIAFVRSSIERQTLKALLCFDLEKLVVLSAIRKILQSLE